MPARPILLIAGKNGETHAANFVDVGHAERTTSGLTSAGWVTSLVDLSAETGDVAPEPEEDPFL